MTNLYKAGRFLGLPIFYLPKQRIYAVCGLWWSAYGRSRDEAVTNAEIILCPILSSRLD